MAKSNHLEDSDKAKSQWDTALRNFSKKLYNRAMLNLREAIQLDHAYLEESHKQLDNYFRSGQAEKAVAVGLAIIGFEPKNFKLMNQIGNAYRRIGHYKKAMQVYQRALKINPKFLNARYNMAACHFKVSAIDEALIHQTKLVEKFNVYRRYSYRLHYSDTIPQFKNQELPKSHTLNQDFPVQETDTEGAELWIAQFEERAKAHANSWEHQFDLAILYDIARFGELALRQYELTAKLSPQNKIIETNWGSAISDYQQNHEQAKELFLGILKRERCDRTTILNLAILYRHMKKPFSMLKYFSYLGELLTKSHGLFSIREMIQLADECYQSGERDKAIDLYEALLIEKDNADWLYRIGILYKQKRKLKSAITYWQKAIVLAPKHSLSHQALQDYVGQMMDEAQQLIDDNFLTDAASILELAASIYPQIETCEMLADIYDELGETQLADQFALQAKKLEAKMNK